tara:strand:+ start:123 stop:794 length:672 start_codon:yes stop_codon:yes gene_type:complete
MEPKQALKTDTNDDLSRHTSEMRLSIAHCLIIAACVAFYLALSSRQFGVSFGPWQCLYAVQDGIWFAAIAFSITASIGNRCLPRFAPGHWILICVGFFHLMQYPIALLQSSQDWGLLAFTRYMVVILLMQVTICIVATIKVPATRWKVFFACLGVKFSLEIHGVVTLDFGHFLNYFGLGVIVLAVVIMAFEASSQPRAWPWLHWISTSVYASTMIPTLAWFVL